MSVREEMLQKIKEWGYEKAAWIFDQVIKEGKIGTNLKLSEEISKSRYINEHGSGHALTVTSVVFNLFRLLIYSGFIPIQSLQRKTVLKCREHYDPEESLIVALVASYVHDIARWTKEKHPDKAAEHFRDPLNYILTNKYYSQEQAECFLNCIQLCIEKHDDLNVEAESIEEAILKLADKLDCTKDRASRREGKKKYPADEVLVKDAKPWHYFSLLNIERINWLNGTEETPVRIQLDIHSYAASPQIKKILEALESVKSIGLSNYVEVYIKELRPETDKPPFRIWPYTVPSNEQYRRYKLLTTETREKQKIDYLLKIVESKDIIDISPGGDADIKSEVVVQNIHSTEHIDRKRCALGATSPMEWEEVKVKAYDFKTNTRLPVVPIKTHDPYRKLWYIRFIGSLPPASKPYKFYYTAKWKRGFPLKTEWWEQFVVSSTDKIITIIKLPEKAVLKEAHAYRATPIDDDVIDRQLKRISPNNNEENRWLLRLEVDAPLENRWYRIEWEIE